MGTVTHAINQDLDELTAKAITSIDRASEDLVAWCDMVRDPDMPWAFHWSKDSLRGPNVAACNYILSAAKRMGMLDQVLTPEQKRQGAAWIHSIEEEDGTFNDPALLGRKPPNWDDDAENWPPDSGHREAVNQYARGCLRFYEDKLLDQHAGPPPPTWPQKGDPDVLNWIKQTEPNWSWIGRTIRRLMLWYHEGAALKNQLLECMDYAYSRQDPETGFWANGIQTTFKLLITVHDPAEMPVPRAEKIIDSVLRAMDKPTYDDNLFPCEEFDAFYDIAIAWSTVPGYRAEEIKKVAAHRIHHILESRRQADRGRSSYIDGCIPTWLKFDMAPAIPQGDAFGWSIFVSGINICIDMLDIADQVSWTGKWRQREFFDTTPFIEVGKELGL